MTSTFYKFYSLHAHYIRTYLQFDTSTEPELVQLTYTVTRVSDIQWTYILAAELNTSFTITPDDVELEGVEARILEYFAPRTISVFNSSMPLIIGSMPATVEYGEVTFEYYVVNNLILVFLLSERLLLYLTADGLSLEKWTSF